MPNSERTAAFASSMNALSDLRHYRFQVLTNDLITEINDQREMIPTLTSERLSQYVLTRIIRTIFMLQRKIRRLEHDEAKMNRVRSRTRKKPADEVAPHLPSSIMPKKMRYRATRHCVPTCLFVFVVITIEHLPPWLTVFTVRCFRFWFLFFATLRAENKDPFG